MLIRVLPTSNIKTRPERLARDQHSSGLYCKPMTILNEDSRVVTKLEASLTDNARVVIYNHHMFIVQATACFLEVSDDEKCFVILAPGVNAKKLTASYR